jgi:hypothetical protein
MPEPLHAFGRGGGLPQEICVVIPAYPCCHARAPFLSYPRTLFVIPAHAGIHVGRRRQVKTLDQVGVRNRR